MKLLTSLMVGAFFMFGAVSAQAQDFDRGAAAYQTGDFATTLKEWRPLAEQGNAAAQYNLGLMYQNGYGVVQNNILSHMWYNIASANGYKKSSEWRDNIATKMTSADISKAQAMARVCMSSGYKNCGW
jgi:uncharacterized protein